MAYELAAARILAPSIGSSTYVWTSVIGVIITALSLGYAFGGKFADARVKPLDVSWLLLASAFGVVFSLLFTPQVLSLLSTTIPDPRFQGLFAALLLFAPASFVLGAISPYLVRLRVASLETSGESVALLSALNSVGGIVGTFAAGFIFFGFIGSKETVVIVAGILLLSSWLVLPKVGVKNRVVATILITLLSALPFLMTPQGLVATIDTPSANYRIFDGEYGGESARFLSTGPKGFQSAVFLGVDDLAFGYTKKMAEVVEQLPKKDSLLILGGGAYTLPDYLANEYPNTQIDVVEIDPELENIATQYFQYSQPENVRTFAEDARAFMNKNEQKYDAILVDVYSDISVPFSLVTKEYAEEVKRSLADDGVVIANVIGANSERCAPMLGSIYAAYSSILPESVIFPLTDTSFTQRQNSIQVYGEALQWLDAKDSYSGHIQKGTLYSDNFAPTERLNQLCEIA